MTRRFLYVLLLALAAATTPSASAALPIQKVAATQDRPAPRAWEHESSDLPVDGRLHFGAFDNGLRWVWAKNAEPKFRSYLRLHVNVGSLAEEDSERGMAHFLEHMAFNGSEHFEPDTLVEWFQRHGMAFGADLNAHTAFSETVYQLDLPNSDEKTLDEALQVLRDFAFGLDLAGAEIDKEKGVIDGEERERDSAGYRLFVRQLQTLFGETRLDDRIPIGVRDVRAKFTSDSVRAFYRKWYRPENMTLVLVGDLGELDPKALFEKHFKGTPVMEGTPAVEPPAGSVRDLSQHLCLHEPEIPSVTLQVARYRGWEDEPFDSERWLRDLPLDAARAMLDLRFAELVKQPDAPFLEAGVGSAEALEALDGEELSIECAPEKWRAAFAAGEQELRRALEHGFQAAELDEVRANALRAMDEAVERAPTQTSASIVAQVLRAAEERFVPTSAVTRREKLAPAWKALTPELCHAALVEAWSRGEPSLVALGNLDLGADAEKELDAALAASRAVEVEKAAEIAVAEFAYASKADEPGKIAARDHVEDLDFERVRFENGVALDVKRTDFREKQVLYRVLFGEGQLTLDQSNLALGWMAQRSFDEGGLVAHSADELRRILAGKQVGVSFWMQQDAFALGGGTTAEDLLLNCELACAYLQAPGWREDGFVQVQRQIPLIYEGLKHQPQGPVAMDFLRELFDGDERFAFFQQDELEDVELDAVREWLAPQLATAPIEVSVVGDIDVEATIQAVARTFGKLPQRRALDPRTEARRAPAPKSGVHQVHAIDTQVPKSLVLTVFPVPDAIDIERMRRFMFLAEVLRDRLRLEVREKLGAAYAPTAGVDQSRVLPGVGMLLVQALTEPGAAEELQAACFGVTDALAKDGVTQEEVDRLREPVLKRLRDTRRENGWWVGLLAEAQRRPAVLDEERSAEAGLRAIEPAALTELARQYLVRERASTVIVNPSSAGAAVAAAAPVGAPVESPGKVLDFQESAPGSSPAGFTSAVTGSGAPGVWMVRADPAVEGARVLAQESRDATSMRFPLCVLDGWSAADASASVRFRAVEGTVDRAAGLVARYRDAGNYYVVRANALEGNVRLYRVVAGERTQFAGKDVEVSAGEWHTLRLDASGKRFAVFLDGALLFTADDGTFAEAGQVGLWTKADSVSWFDELRVGPVPEDSPTRGQGDATGAGGR
jgi:zinc protease